jgi:pimeloyl-ACP methyl ester carboxylesterase
MKSLLHFSKVLRPLSYALVALAFGGASLESVYGQSTSVGEKGVLPRGTVYEMRKPEQWNGTLVSDLDFARFGEGYPIYAWLLGHGYAISGTARRDDRLSHYDPAHELIDLVNVMDLFEAKFGKPKHTIQMGRSGGGHIALAMAETHPDRIDGALSLCAHTPIWQQNSNLDTWFTLQTLIAPALPITDVRPKKEPNGNFYEDMMRPVDPELTVAWRSALEEAQQTPIGRARIALATTIGQQPALTYNVERVVMGAPPAISWDSIIAPEPNLTDILALENRMYESFHYIASWPGGQGRLMLELSSPGQPTWNSGIDYVKLYKAGEPAYQKATRELYAKAAGDLDADLAKLNSAKRVEADPRAVQYWSAPGRTVVGEPKVPVLRIDGTQDPATIASMAGYEEAVKAHGFSSLYRPVFIDAAGHCNYTVSEVAAGVETLIQRLNMGQWGDTSPAAMNKLAATLDPSSGSRFRTYKELKYNRGWVPTVAAYMGAGHGGQQPSTRSQTRQ